MSLTIALTRTSEKKAQLIKAGTAHVIATEEVDLVGEVMRITNGRGARARPLSLDSREDSPISQTE